MVRKGFAALFRMSGRRAGAPRRTVARRGAVVEDGPIITVGCCLLDMMLSCAAVAAVAGRP
jgi:hypothetical protein